MDRLDGFEGPVTFELQDLPDGLVQAFPLPLKVGNGMLSAAFMQQRISSPGKGTLRPKLLPEQRSVVKLSNRQSAILAF